MFQFTGPCLTLHHHLQKIGDKLGSSARGSLGSLQADGSSAFKQVARLDKLAENIRGGFWWMWQFFYSNDILGKIELMLGNCLHVYLYIYIYIYIHIHVNSLSIYESISPTSIYLNLNSHTDLVTTSETLLNRLQKDSFNIFCHGAVLITQGLSLLHRPSHSQHYRFSQPKVVPQGSYRPQRSGVWARAQDMIGS